MVSKKNNPGKNARRARNIKFATGPPPTTTSAKTLSDIKIKKSTAKVLNQAGEAMQAVADVVEATAAPAPKTPRKYLDLPAYDWSHVNLKDLQDFARKEGIHFSPDDTKETLQAILARWAETGYKNKRKTSNKPRQPRKKPNGTRKPRERHYGPRLPRKTRSDKGQKKGELKKDGTPRKKPGPQKGYKRRTKN